MVKEGKNSNHSTLDRHRDFEDLNLSLMQKLSKNGRFESGPQ